MGQRETAGVLKSEGAGAVPARDALFENRSAPARCRKFPQRGGAIAFHRKT